MTKKHYQMIAVAIRRELSGWQQEGNDDFGQTEVIEGVACAIGYELAKDNPRFDRSRFMTACGFPEGEPK